MSFASIRSFLTRIAQYFAPPGVILTPEPTAPAPAPTWAWTADRTKGGKRTVVASGVIHADSPSAALALLVNTGKVFAGEAVKIDGTRYRVWANARPTPIDPAHRSGPGDRRRDRERNVNG